ncbi:MAG TPA: DinB family protein [Terriglobales bacterium]|nr:DinB family protein [Terriglobales bacterium]
MSATATLPQITEEFAVTTRDFAVAGFEREIQATKKVIEAIPEDKKHWKPDPKAKSAEELAWHIASVEVGMLYGIANLRFMTMGEEEEVQKNPPKTIAEIAKWYAENLPKAVEKIHAMTPKQLLTPIDFFGAFNFPAFMYLEFAKVHTIHHRGWLASYLRPMGSKCPSIYGGSADEPWQA